MSQYSVMPFKCSTLLFRTTLLPGCSVWDYGTLETWECVLVMGQRRQSRLSNWETSYFCALLWLHDRLVLARWIFVCPQSWQRGQRGWFWGTLHILWTAVVWLGLVGLLHCWDVSPVSLQLIRQAAAWQWASLTFSLSRYSYRSLSHTYAHSLTHTLSHRFPFVSLYFCRSPVHPLDGKKLRINGRSGRNFGCRSCGQMRCRHSRIWKHCWVLNRSAVHYLGDGKHRLSL